MTITVDRRPNAIVHRQRATLHQRDRQHIEERGRHAPQLGAEGHLTHAFGLAQGIQRIKHAERDGRRHVGTDRIDLRQRFAI